MNQLEQPKKQRFILVKVGEMTVVFPSDLVSEIGIIQEKKIINLPFYHQTLKGCIYYNGKIISLVDLKKILGINETSNKEKMIVICLSQKAEKFAGIGLIADKVLGGKNETELSSDLSNKENNILLFQLEMLKQDVWEAQGYYANKT